ncbi:MAG: dienelactone hydrolase family protein [Planctomycetaceae bacterium]
MIVRLSCCVLLCFLMSGLAAGQDALTELKSFLSSEELSDAALKKLEESPLAKKELTREEAQEAVQLLWKARREFLARDRKAEVDAREIVIGDLKMPFWFKTFGEAPASGRRLFISMHGGGGAPAAVNDQQYENQKRLYQPEEGIYLVPRAPGNTWDLWHQGHVDQFFDRVITDMAVLENVDLDRVYIMGYSAGGDGVYQLAPRMADRLAAAAMMAGHPNESRPEGLRNIGFTLHMGANDGAYNRNTVAADWGKKLDALQKDDPDGYVHEVKLHEGKGHWMNLQDAVAVPWMSKFQRNPWPKKVVWVQDDVRHSRFYWLQVDEQEAKAGDEIVAEVKDEKIVVTKCSAKKLTLLLSDELVPLDKPLAISLPSGLAVPQAITRTVGTMARSLAERNDGRCIATATVTIEVAP